MEPTWIPTSSAATTRLQIAVQTGKSEKSTITCSQCGRAAPVDTDELRRWKHGDLVLDEQLDAAAAATMLLCPACVEEDDSRAYDEGVGN